MSYERPGWTAQPDMPPQLPAHKMVNIDVNEFVRTRDALTSAYIGLSNQVDRAVKAYLDHTQVVLNSDASLNVSHLLQPFNILTQYAQTAQLALQQNGGGMMIPVGSEEPVGDGKKKRKKRAYKQRDPNAPKRPLTAYFRYLGEKRAEIQADIQAHPDKYAASGKPGDITKIATDMWNGLSKEEQEPYRQAYQAALKDYEIDVAAYKNVGGKTEVLDETANAIDADGQLQAEAAAEEEDDDSDSSDSDEDEEPAAPPPPPPPQKAPKSSSKKSKQAAAAAVPAPALESVDPAPSASPDRKRKSSDEEGGKKKRGRKGDKVVAGSDPIPAATAPIASSPAPVESSKKKKDKKKKGGA